MGEFFTRNSIPMGGCYRWRCGGKFNEIFIRDFVIYSQFCRVNFDVICGYNLVCRADDVGTNVRRVRFDMISFHVFSNRLFDIERINWSEEWHDHLLWNGLIEFQFHIIGVLCAAEVGEWELSCFVRACSYY